MSDRPHTGICAKIRTMINALKFLQRRTTSCRLCRMDNTGAAGVLALSISVSTSAASGRLDQERSPPLRKPQIVETTVVSSRRWIGGAEIGRRTGSKFQRIVKPQSIGTVDVPARMLSANRMGFKRFQCQSPAQAEIKQAQIARKSAMTGPSRASPRSRAAELPLRRSPIANGVRHNRWSTPWSLFSQTCASAEPCCDRPSFVCGGV